MYEKAKLDEARYFYGRMSECHDDRRPFLYNLSAFLSAACSVQEYAIKEAGSRRGGAEWYGEHIANSRILRFFEKQRNINIHRQPLAPRQDVTIELTEGLHFSASLGITLVNASGEVVDKTVIEDSQPKPAPTASLPITTVRYSFADWKGPEDLMVLSELYLEELEAVVNEGISKGFLD